MAMPMDLVLVRHGESEGNVASYYSRLGNDTYYTDEFRRRHSARWRLTDRGIEQAKAAGEWLHREFPEPFDRYYTSEYLRAMETAMLLDFPDSEWFVEFYLREREWGDIDTLTYKERMERFAESMHARERDSFYWTPPNGESMAQLCLRIDRVLNTLHRECAEKRVVIVCHGEVMWGFRVRLEKMSQQRFFQLDTSKDPMDRIHNCQILHYTRCNLETHEMQPTFDRMRSVCPWDESLSSNAWQKIDRPSYTTAELREMVLRAPRLVNASIQAPSGIAQ